MSGVNGLGSLQDLARDNAESHAVLFLYGLVRSMSVNDRPPLLALDRLSQLNDAQRSILYSLLESYALGLHRSQEWQDSLAELDQMISNR